MSHHPDEQHILGLILSCQLPSDPEKWRKPALSEIDEKDQEIINHLSEGFTTKEIATEIFLSIPAIKKRIQKLFKLYGAKNAKELIRIFKEAA